MNQEFSIEGSERKNQMNQEFSIESAEVRK